MSKYWDKRYHDLMKAQMNKADKLSDEVLFDFIRTFQSLNHDVNAWIRRFALENNMSYTEAIKKLKDKELDEFKWDVEEYIKKATQNASNPILDAVLNQKLKNASARVHLTRLQAISVKLANLLNDRYAKTDTKLSEFLKKLYGDTYLKSVWETSDSLQPYTMISSDKIDLIINTPWTADGKTFSDRLWTDKNKLINDLQSIMTRHIIRGSNPDKMIAELSKRMNVAKSQAKRLILTESSYFNNHAIGESFKRLDVAKYQFLATEDDRTSDICRHMDLKVFNLKDKAIGINYPPMHCHCRSTVVPYLPEYDEETDTRIAKDDTGKKIKVPHDMPYQDWYDKYVLKNTVVNTGNAVNTNSGWQKIKYHKSYTRDESIQVLKNYQIDYTEGKKKKADEVILSNIAEFVKTFYDRYPNVLKNNSNPLKNIDMLTSSKMSSHVAGRFRYYTNNYIPHNIELNLKYHEDFEYALFKMEGLVKNGWQSQAISANHVFVHEWGHYISNCFTRIKNDTSWEDNFIRKVIDTYNLKYNANIRSCMDCNTLVSKYGSTKNCELFAECFAEYFEGDNPREFSKVFGELLEEELKKL